MRPRTAPAGLGQVATGGGRKLKGDRAAMHVRVPSEHKRRYEQLADEAGLFVGDYIALVLARAHGLDEPDYLPQPLRNEELPLGA